VDLLSVVGIGVVLGLMVFGFVGLRPALVVSAASALVSAPFVVGFLHDYATLSGSLVAYAVSTLVCVALSVRSGEDFDFALIKERTGDFDTDRQPLDEDPDPMMEGVLR
jgi:hypothetical protein